MENEENRGNVLNEMKICRFCLSNEDNELTNIYERRGRITVPLPLQIMACIAIEVFENDGMPQLICNTCRDQTLQAYAFKNNCKRADDALKLFLFTGQLSKPQMDSIQQYRKPQKNVKVAGKQNVQVGPSHDLVSHEKRPAQTEASKNNKSKRFKMEAGSEVITLTFSDREDDGMESHQESNENHSILIVNGSEVEDSGQHATEFIVGLDASESDAKKMNTCYACPDCERTFPLKQLYDIHVLKHNRERPFSCDTCGKRFFTKYDLTTHISTHSDVKGNYGCSACNKSFSSLSVLRRHEKIHVSAPKYFCKQCDRVFLSIEDLDVHMDRHQKMRPYMCQECDKSFVFKQGLDRHLQVHAVDKSHKCNYCDASFNTAIKLTRHLTSHAGLRPYPCKLCKRTFLMSHHLSRHMRSHYAAMLGNMSEDVIGHYKCDVCSMAFSKKESLINHSAIHSMVNLKCVICDTAFESAQEVKEHITTHLQLLPFPCEKCDYSFETCDQLEEHELKHAQMEYEDQIEQEVLSEVQYDDPDVSQSNNSYDNFIPDEEHLTKFASIDIGRSVNNMTDNTEDQRDVDPSDDDGSSRMATYYLKLDDNSSNVAETELVPKPPPELEKEEEQEEILNQPSAYENIDDTGSMEDPFEEKYVPGPKENVQENSDNVIKPIVRNENTKVYQRKAIQRKIPQITAMQNSVMASMEQITQIDDVEQTVDTTTYEDSTSIISNKVKMVTVQKFLLTKDEMKQMAKEGLLEIKAGKVVLKSGSRSILNATLKPIHKSDIENLIAQKPKAQLKQYQRRSVGSSFGGETSYTTANSIPSIYNVPSRFNIDLDTNGIDLLDETATQQILM